MKQFDNKNLVNNLPDCYAKSTDSNNYNILQIEKVALELLSKDIEDVLNAKDLNIATGDTLDRYGEMVNQPRGLATDSQYRLMIRAKIMQNLSGGDYKSVLKALYMTFGCEPSRVSIIQSDTPCTVKIERVPLDIITSAGLSTAQTTQIIKRLLPVGIDVETYFYEGTFEFSENENDMSIDGATKGFTDTELNMTSETAIGGILGEIYDGDEIDLPI